MKNSVTEKIIQLFKKYKDYILYVLLGAGTSGINIILFWLLHEELCVHELWANAIAWFFAVLFSFLTNRIWVFHSPSENFAHFAVQMLKFYLGRLLTLLIEEGIIFVFITKLGFNSMLIKIIATVIVIILNYVISKFMIFAKKNKDAEI